MDEQLTSPAIKKKRPQRGLSATKRRGRKENGSATTGSIASFFSNAPPAKLACPVCGEMVPRFFINEHIDRQCHLFQRDHEKVVSSVTSGDELPICSSQDTTTNCSLEGASHTEHDKHESTSPYFKKQGTDCSFTCQGKTEVKEVKTVDLGSLSSKLSRRHLKFPRDVLSTNSSASGKSSEAFCVVKQENLISDTDTTVPEGIIDAGTEEKTVPPSPPEVEPLARPITVPPQLSKRKQAEEPSQDRPAAATREMARSVNKKARFEEDHRGTGDVPAACESRELPGQLSTVDVGARTSPGKTMPVTQFASCDGPLLSSSAEAALVACAVSRCVPAPAAVKQADADPSEMRGRERIPDSARQPYYLRNFRMVLDTVLVNPDDRMLFNQEDLAAVQTFKELSAPGQMLYVRLFQRKLHWLRVNKLDYVEISTDLRPVVEELARCGLLQRESELEDLEEVLELLPAPELRSLAKTFHLGATGSQKQQLVEALLRLGRQRSLFAPAPGQGGAGTAAIILKRAKQQAGQCVRLCRGPRAVFSRLLLLFSLADSLDEEELGPAGHTQLYTILLVSSGRLAFPDYTILRKARLFQDREELIGYEAAMRTLHDVTVLMQAGSWEEALNLYLTAKATWQEQRDTCSVSHQEQLPLFLRFFTTGWAYTRILSRGVEILQRLRRYEEAVEELKSLLAQSVYCPDSRGRWWDRLALNLQQHLKRPEQAISAIQGGLLDPLVRTGHRLSLYQRAVRMRESPSYRRLRLRLRDLPSVLVQDVPHVTIRGQLCPHPGGMGKSVFLMAEDEREEGTVDQESGCTTVMCSVEELALAHYRRLGFDQGIHGEGSTFSTLFGLLLWDVVFMDGIPDVFRNPYQTCPLDLHTDCFYGNRKEALEVRVRLLREASVATLHGLLGDTWHAQEGKVCALVSWERFSSLQHAQSLVSCLGGPFLAGLVQRMAQDYRHCRGGLPDLVVWSTKNTTYKLVEVKGPNDRLSQKQQIWLDELQKLGADVEVCHVTDVGARGTC